MSCDSWTTLEHKPPESNKSEVRYPHNIAQQAKESMAGTGGRFPRQWRKSGISANTSMSGGGCVIMRVDLGKGVWLMRSVPGKQGLAWDQPLYPL